MKIRLYKPVALYLLQMWGNRPDIWEREFAKLSGISIKLPLFFWEVHLFRINNRVPRHLTIECEISKDWYSVFYSYNLEGDLKKYLEIILLKKCIRHRDTERLKFLRTAG